VGIKLLSSLVLQHPSFGSAKQVDKEKNQLRPSQIAVAAIATVLILTPLAYLAFFSQPAALPAAPQQNDNEETTSTLPSIDPTPKSSPEPPSSIDITYSLFKNVSVSWNLESEYGGRVPAETGKMFLFVDIRIKNNGNETFSTNLYYFHVVADGVSYGVDNHTLNVGNWDLMEMRNGETFRGTLLFQIPATTDSIAMDYQRAWHVYDISWTEE